MEKIKIGIASDHGGFNLKSKLIEVLGQDYEIVDYGTNSIQSVDYPVFAKKVANAIVSGEIQKGILVCGTGLGMSLAANKVKGIRAICCSDTTSARYSRMHNNANILCLGERIVGSLLAEDIAKIWLTTEFEGGRHQKRVDMIEEL